MPMNDILSDYFGEEQNICINDQTANSKSLLTLRYNVSIHHLHHKPYIIRIARIYLGYHVTRKKVPHPVSTNYHQTDNGQYLLIHSLLGAIYSLKYCGLSVKKSYYSW